MDPPTPRPEELPPIPPTQASSSFAPQLYDADPDLSGGLDRRPHHPAPRSHAPRLPSPKPAHAGRPPPASPAGGRHSPPGAAAGTSWEAIQARIHDFRARLPPTVPCAREVVFDDRRQRLYFLGTDPQQTGKAQSLFYTDLSELRGAGFGLDGPRSRDVPALPWQPLLGKAWTAAKPEKLSKEELLLRERMRMGSAGISSFTFDEVGNVVLFAFGGSLFLAEATPVRAFDAAAAATFGGRRLTLGTTVCLFSLVAPPGGGAAAAAAAAHRGHRPAAGPQAGRSDAEAAVVCARARPVAASHAQRPRAPALVLGPAARRLVRYSGLCDAGTRPPQGRTMGVETQLC